MIEAFGDASLVALLVVPFAKSGVHQNQDCGKYYAYHYNNKPWNIAWSIFGFEDEGTSEVAYAWLVA